MSQRLNEYFASEATEYLDEIERLLTLPGIPDFDSLLRLSTGVRGSAKMAGADSVATVAGRLELAVHSLRSTRVEWSDEFRDVSRQTVADLKSLVQAPNHSDGREGTRVEDALGRLDRVEPFGAGTPAQAVSVSTLFYEDAGSAVLGETDEEMSAAVLDEYPVVSVDTLLFRGAAAIREALSLRSVIERALSNGDDDGARLSDLLDELFDLLDLGLSPDPLEGR